MPEVSVNPVRNRRVTGTVWCHRQFGEDVMALMLTGLFLVASGLGPWWAAPNVAAPLPGLMLAAVGAVLAATAVLVPRRGRTRSSESAKG
jgi:hypothetical protein